MIIPLPSLVHRIGGEQVKQAKEMALELRCELKRIRRSRNWQLEGELKSVMSLLVTLRQSHAEPMAFLIKKIDESLIATQTKPESKVAILERLIAVDPDITLAELMHQTDCTMAEARQARFTSDSF
ncbi:ribosome recycling factor [Vibrio sp. S17_S38]|uniref:ribosome recycling factor family protein n=1 Tax=Vibrio sp. S17_S38 TaxID=2720229 RepID=UPI00168119CB|nr:ribosome recycling factor family protein [Vibrio sp. S17_S38]MBD1572044.1 ribosome recycling factor [Vibrio sp. S17_S38]